MTTVILFAALCALAASLLVGRRRLTRSRDLMAPPPEPSLPQPFGYKMSWIAVRTRDTARLIKALDVVDFARATWSDGIREIYDERTPTRRIFITPPIGDWTLVAGLSLPHPLGPAFIDKCTPLITRLSQTFGETHYFFSFPLLDFFAWAKAKDGDLVRAFACGDEGIIWNRGRLTAEERELSLKFFELRGIEDRHGDLGGDMQMMPTEDQVLRLAGRWSVDPSRLDDSEDQRGFGYVALTPQAWRSERVRKSAA